MKFFCLSVRPRGLTQDVMHALSQTLSRALRLSPQAQVGILFVSLPRMQSLNRRFRRKNRPTDVLSFPVEPTPDKGQRAYLGDVVMCPAYAKAEARRRGLSPLEEYVRLLTHGLLHLRGYDHATAKDELDMFSTQEKIVDKLKDFF